MRRLALILGRPALPVEVTPTAAQLAQARLEGAQAVLDAVVAADAALCTPWRMVKDAREAAERVGEVR